jgi:TRAP-type uncharacterized transport system substrate-binding protein
MMVISQAVFSWLSWSRVAAVVVSTGLTGAATIGGMATNSAKEVFVSIGTGETSGVYYPVVKAIC